MQTGRYIHIGHSDLNKFGWSGLSVFDEISRGNSIKIDSFLSIFKILRETKKGDNLIFHARSTLLESLLFLIFNRITGRNRVAYQSHTRLRPILINKIFMKLFVDRVICLTRHNQQELIENGFSNTIFIPNPVPFNRIQKYMTGKKEYDTMWIGRDVPYKRLGVFLDSMKYISGLKALVLTPQISQGNREKIKSMKNIELKEGLNDDEFFRQMTKSKSYVFTSNDNEGFGIVLLEVAYLGIPIIATDSEKFREILGDGAVFWKDEQDLGRILKALSEGKLSIPPVSKKLLEE